MVARAATVDAYRKPESDLSARLAPFSVTLDVRRDTVTAATPTFRALRAARDKSGSMRLVDAMRCVEPTWVEGVAVVQAVCAQLARGETPPAIGDIVLLRSGAVSFPLGGIIDVDLAIQAMGRLLTVFLRVCGGPLSMWEATELTRCAPMSFSSVQGFRAALTCFPTERGAKDLAAYFQQSRDLVGAASPTAARRRPGASAPSAFVW